MKYRRILNYMALALLLASLPSTIVMLDNEPPDGDWFQANELDYPLMQDELVPFLICVALVLIAVAQIVFVQLVPLQYWQGYCYSSPQIRIHAPPVF